MTNVSDCGTQQAPGHGTICWSELNVRDAERAKKFYADTLGWTFQGMPMEGFTYWLVTSEGARVGIFEMKGKEFEGVPEHWLTYIAVDDIDARTKKAKAAGAEICKDPFDIPGVGRMAVLKPPGGAYIAWMTPKPA